MYSKKYNLLFIHIPKTGGQSITKHFMKFEGIHWENRRQYLLFPNGDKQHGPPQTAHFTIHDYYNTDLIADNVIDNAIKLSVVRNPWARLWSEYNFHWNHICSWDEFFKYFPDYIFDDHKTGRDALQHIKPQVEFINGDVELIKFEHLRGAFSAFCLRHGLPYSQLTNNNSSNSEDYRDVYDAKKIKAVAKFYEEDILTFGYTFDN